MSTPDPAPAKRVYRRLMLSEKGKSEARPSSEPLAKASKQETAELVGWIMNSAGDYLPKSNGQ